MKYPVIFSLLAVTLVYWAVVLPTAISWALLWPALNLLMLAVAYTLRKPSMILGKTSEGRISKILLLVNLPWLLLSWAVFWIQSKLSRESQVDQIGESNFYIGRCPFHGADLSSYGLIIDLTAEFPLWYKHDAQYVCRPNLDGVALTNASLPGTVTDKEKVLIHCAQGHGRSATYASLLMGSIPAFAPATRALHLIQQSRPGAIPCKGQLRQIDYGQQVDPADRASLGH